MEERWPPLIAQEGWEGLYQEDTGILHADTAVRTLQEQARAAGAALFEFCVVESIVGVAPVHVAANTLVPSS